MSASSGLRLTARGHPNVKASHPKTLEWVPEPELGPRGTCILGVGLAGDLDALARLRGPVEIELRCGGRQERLRACLSPGWLPGEALILRKRPEPLARRTLAVAADKGAADLDRALVAALADPTARLEIAVTPRGEPAPPGALFLAHPAGRETPRLAAARRLADLHLAGDLSGLAATIASGGRVLLESAEESLLAAAVAQTRAVGGLVTLAGGWPEAEGAWALAGLAAPVRAQVRAWPDGKPARRALLTRLAAAGGALLLVLPAGQAESLLGLAAKTLGARAATLVRDPGGPQEAVRQASLPALAESPAPGGAAWLLLEGAAPQAEVETEAAAAALDPQLLALAGRLQAAGVATKPLAQALAETLGRSRREIFNLLVKL